MKKKSQINENSTESSDKSKEIQTLINEGLEYLPKKHRALFEKLINIPTHTSQAIEDAKQQGKNKILNWMSKTTIQSAISSWLNSIENNTTRNSYKRGIQDLIDIEFIEATQSPTSSKQIATTLYQFAHIPHDLIPQQISMVKTWTSPIRSRNISAYKSFIKFLANKTEGIISFAYKPVFANQIPSEPSVTISKNNLETILSILHKENPRDFCLIKIFLASPFKLSELALLKRHNIDISKNTISIAIGKNQKLTTFNYHSVLDLEKTLPDFRKLGEKDLVFFTRNGKPVDPMQITRTLNRAFQKAKIEPMPLKDLKKNY